MIDRSVMAGFLDSRRSLSPARRKNARWQKLAAASTTPSRPAITSVPPVPQGRSSAPFSSPAQHPAASTTPSRPAITSVSPVLAEKRLGPESSGRHPQRPRALPAASTMLALEALVMPVSQNPGHLDHFRPFLTPVSTISGHREQWHRVLKGILQFVMVLSTLLFISCSRPGSYEQFVMAEDAADGIYEFVIPATLSVSGIAKESGLRAISPSGGKSGATKPDATGRNPATFDLSFYTASLTEPLQLEITWLLTSVSPASKTSSHMDFQTPVEAKQLDTNGMAETPLQIKRSFCESGDNQETVLYTETVWFPAGVSSALYRSGVRLSVAGAFPSGTSLRSPHHPSGTVSPLSNTGFLESGSFLGSNYGYYVSEGQASAPATVVLNVQPINPPEDFRGLGIIIKQNDGTR